MDLKIVLCLCLLLVGVTIAYPTEEFQVTELVIPPPEDYGPILEACLMDDADCPARNAKTEKDHTQHRKDELNQWVSGMSDYGKAHWKEQYPDAAKEMDELSG